MRCAIFVVKSYIIVLKGSPPREAQNWLDLYSFSTSLYIIRFYDPRRFYFAPLTGRARFSRFRRPVRGKTWLAKRL